MSDSKSIDRIKAVLDLELSPEDVAAIRELSEADLGFIQTYQALHAPKPRKPRSDRGKSRKNGTATQSQQA